MFDRGENRTRLKRFDGLSLCDDYAAVAAGIIRPQWLDAAKTRIWPGFGGGRKNASGHDGAENSQSDLMEKFLALELEQTLAGCISH